jgi:hypothetical protein
MRPLSLLSLVTLLACSGAAAPAAPSDPTSSTAQAVTPSGPATCATDDDCVGKPAKPNVMMCMRGASVSVRCRAGLCAAGCDRPDAGP